jgi:hypothetical protein
LASSEARSGGVGFFGLLAVLFIGLKLGGVIDWNWFLVLAPIWAPMAIGFGMLLLVVAVSVMIGGFTALIDWSRK